MLDGHLCSCPHLRKHRTRLHLAAVLAQRKVTAVSLPPQHGWEGTFPDCVHRLVPNEHALMDYWAGKTDGRQGATQGAETSKGELTWRPASQCGVTTACRSSFMFYFMLLAISRLYRTNYRSIWKSVKAPLTEGKNSGLITDTGLKNIISIHFDNNRGCTCPVQVPVFIHHKENTKPALPLTRCWFTVTFRV